MTSGFRANRPGEVLVEVGVHGSGDVSLLVVLPPGLRIQQAEPAIDDTQSRFAKFRFEHVRRNQDSVVIQSKKPVFVPY